MLGALALRKGATVEAEELARKLVEGDPAGLDARAWQAKVLGDLGRPLEAEEALRRLVDLRPEAPAPWAQLLMFQAARKDRAGASATIEQMMTRVKVDRPDLLRATCCRAVGRRDLADPAFLAALRALPDDLPTLRSAIDYYEETGRPERAEPLLRKVRGANPGLDWARRRLALVLAGRPGDPSSWREALDLAGEGSDASDSPDDRLARAVVLSVGPAPRRAEAVEILEKLAAEMPDNPKVREALARALLGVGERAKAREHADRAARSADSPPDAIRLAGSLDLALGDLDTASRRLDRLGSPGLDDPETLDLAARVLKARGRAAEAVALVEKSFEAAGSPSPEAGRGLVRLLSSLGEVAAAEAMARKVARLGPLGSVVLAEYLASLGRFDEASTAYDAASRDRQGARESALSALDLASTNREARWSDLADRLLDRAIGTGPVDDEMLYARASLRHLQGRLEEAVKLYDELAGRSPANFVFLNNCAWILSEDLGRPLEGLKRVEALAAKGMVQPHTLDTRGVILLRLGRVDRAIGDLEAAASANPSGPIYYHLARAYLAAARRDDAARALARASAAGLKPEALQPSERAEFARVSEARSGETAGCGCRQPKSIL